MAKTYYATDTARATGVHAATAAEYALATATGSAAAISVAHSDTTARLEWVWTGAAGEPASAAWPTGDYSAQIDCTINDGAYAFGFLGIGGAGGHLARVDSGLTSDIEAKAQDEAAFTGTGIKTANWSGVSWSSGSADDRVELALAAQRGNSHGTKTLELEVNESDDALTGPWIGSDTLSPGDATHDHSAAAVPLTQSHALTAVASDHSHAASSPDLAVTTAIVVDETAQAHLAGDTTLSQQSTVVPAQSDHAHGAAVATLVAEVLLIALQAAHAQVAAIVDLSVSQTLSLDEAHHALASDGVTFAQFAGTVGAGRTVIVSGLSGEVATVAAAARTAPAAARSAPAAVVSRDREVAVAVRSKTI